MLNIVDRAILQVEIRGGRMRYDLRILMFAFGALIFGITGQHSAQSTETPTFSKDVAPILYRNCVTCHRPGEMAPMSLLTYQQVRPFARSIRDRVELGA